MQSVLQDDGRTALAVAIKTQPLHVAWGTGNPAWDSAPEPEPTNATALVSEVGRRTATSVDYVLPDAAGTIVLPTGDKYSVSPTPTPWVYVRTVFEFGDAVGATIREIGLFVGTQTDGALPPGQRYFTPAQVVSPGRLYLLNRQERIVRSGGTYQAIEFVLPF